LDQKKRRSTNPDIERKTNVCAEFDRIKLWNGGKLPNQLFENETSTAKIK
jgi:hypothetical protein